MLFRSVTHFLQRFALRPHAAYDQTAAMKFALEHQNPLVTATVIGITNSPYPATNYSLLNISHPNVLLWAIKVHDDGIEHGLVARVWNQSAAPAQVKLVMPRPLQSAQRVTHIEKPLESLPVKNGVLELAIAAQRMESVALRPETKQ